MAKEKRIHLLLVEKNHDKANAFIKSLAITKIYHLHITPVSNLEDACRELNGSIKDIIIIDNENVTGDELAVLHQRFPSIPILVLANEGNVKNESIMMEKGAQEYLLKKYVTPYHLEHAIKRTIERNHLRLAAEATNPHADAVPSSQAPIKKKTPTASHKQVDPNMLLLRAKHQRQAEALLSDLERRYALILESAGEGIYGLDADGRIMFINPAAENLLGWEPGALTGKIFHQIAHYAHEDGSPYPHDHCPLDHITNQNKTIQGSNEFFWRKDGSCFPIEYTSTPIIENGQLVGTVVNFRNITERRQTEKQMTKLAMHDTLTSLANRLQFEKALKESVNAAERNKQILALLFVDLDEFKRVNDNLGHDVGDRLLQEVAKRLYSCVRKNDFIARLGGDEFAVILPYLKDSVEAGIVAQKIIDHLSSPFKLGNYQVRVSASVGIACYPKAADNASELLKAADIAMYRAKELGRNNYQYFSQEVKEQNALRNKLEVALRDALANKEFSLMYQPKYQLRTKKMTGFEVLVRWHSQKLGAMRPDEFIPVAEETGILISIGEWLVKEACRQYSLWRKAYHIDYKLAINFSPRQLIKPNLPAVLNSILKANDVPSQNIELELTESAIMSEHEAEETLRKLHKLGISFAIDDFGTGYSSLSRLRSLPISSLKIDKSFINDLMENKNDALIVKSIIALGNNLGLNVIAEGIETEKQLNFLIRNKCNEGQGHYFSEPLSAGEIEKLLQKMNESKKFKPKKTKHARNSRR